MIRFGTLWFRLMEKFKHGVRAFSLSLNYRVPEAHTALSIDVNACTYINHLA